ncbi:MAG: FtsQ-type POTRA domain-containing protein, partial [Calditrichaeota bacterium]|nr:FtsQ-type POTRA domain-containing protein [Calditrichota bacterium]
MQGLIDRDSYGLRHLEGWVRLIVVAAAVSVGGGLLGRGILSYIQVIGVFDLRRIEVRGNNILTRAEVVDAMALPLVGSIFDVDLSAVQEQVEVLNYVYGVRLGRKFPHTLF